MHMLVYEGSFQYDTILPTDLDFPPGKFKWQI